jgi:hypothetical protein
LSIRKEVKMMENFEKSSIAISLTPWGVEVKKRLIDKGMKQQDLVDILQRKGYNINKHVMSMLLRGMCVSTRQAEIQEINEMLGI